MSYHIRHNNYLFIRDVRNQSESGQRYLCAYNFNNQPCNVKLWCLATGERVTMGTHNHHLNAGVNIPPSEEAASFRDNHAPRGINNSSRTQRLRFNRALALQAASSFRATQSTRNTRINQPRQRVIPVPQSFADLHEYFLMEQKINSIYLAKVIGSDNSIGYLFGNSNLITKLGEVREWHVDITFQVI
ncbi:uncharacterized protein LOC141537243 [Cotesia typhae]|uniref:uncharacterized protein LOC141537243 n=1 Tax=Cotesia typhae TaxID=2053667 RepID=UPI003D6802B3